jgi:hypothetical protein
MTSTQTRTIRRRIAIGWLPVLLLFVLGGSMAGCSGASPGAPTGAAWTSAPAAPASAGASSADAVAQGNTMGHAMPTAAEVDAAWAARPGYVRTASARTVEAYAYAIARPDVIDWMPCYCGCAAMDHRNNTDCYVKPREDGAPVVFEEHASYCEICVDIALTAKSMLADGKSLLQIRIAVDGEYGSTAPGTDTALPAN